jgi:hypothetical protein
MSPQFIHRLNAARKSALIEQVKIFYRSMSKLGSPPEIIGQARRHTLYQIQIGADPWRPRDFTREQIEKLERFERGEPPEPPEPDGGIPAEVPSEVDGECCSSTREALQSQAPPDAKNPRLCGGAGLSGLSLSGSDTRTSSPEALQGQPGCGRVIDIAALAKLLTDHKASRSDQEFFERNPVRSHRLRPASQIELAQYRQFFIVPETHFVFVAICQIMPGIRVREWFSAIQFGPLNQSEESAKHEFKAASKRRAA